MKLMRAAEAEAILSSLYGQPVAILQRAGDVFGIPTYVSDALPPDEIRMIGANGQTVRLKVDITAP